MHLDLRRAWRIRVPAEAVEGYRRACRQYSLGMAATRDQWTADAGGQLRPAAAGALESAHLAVVAATDAAAQAILDAELSLHRALSTRGQVDVAAMLHTHRTLGAAYGYPSCCVEAFADAFSEVVATDRRGDNPLALARAARRSRQFAPLLQTLATGMGEENATPLRHLPCRFDCQASLDLAIKLGGDAARAAAAARNFVVMAGGEMWVTALPLQRRGRTWAGQRGDWRGLRRDEGAPAWHRAAQHADRVAVKAGELVLHVAGERHRVEQPAGSPFPVVLPFAG